MCNIDREGGNWRKLGNDRLKGDICGGRVGCEGWGWSFRNVFLMGRIGPCIIRGMGCGILGVWNGDERGGVEGKLDNGTWNGIVEWGEEINMGCLMVCEV